MKQTDNFGLYVMETADPVSAKPLNENAAAIDAALQAHKAQILTRPMMACGSYVGDGTRSVVIQTPGFKAQIVLMKEKMHVADTKQDDVFGVSGGWCLWNGSNLSAVYEVYARADEVSGDYGEGELRRDAISTTVAFASAVGNLTWSISDRPDKYYDVRDDSGPKVMNNAQGITYEWIALGVAGG